MAKENPLLEQIRRKIERRQEAMVQGEPAPPPLSGDELGENVKLLRDTIVELQEQLSEQGATLRRQAEELKQVRGRLSERESELNSIRKRMGELHSAMAAKEKLIEDLRAELEEARSVAGGDVERIEELRQQQAVLLAEVDRLRAEKAALEEKVSFFESRRVENPYGNRLGELIARRETSATARLPLIYYELERELEDALTSVFGARFRVDKQDIIGIVVVSGMLRLVQDTGLTATLETLKDAQGDYLRAGLRQVLAERLLI